MIDCNIGVSENGARSEASVERTTREKRKTEQQQKSGKNIYYVIVRSNLISLSMSSASTDRPSVASRVFLRYQ